ncbi:hypothetical protein HBA54_21920 [Pelagibius litoralis]|uniref:Uncharacterized protein n=1 Tax=Pelagibius litoralis TaxID=374515 RepID=A0A967KBS6_9PROT|nr:hypothetical protein [Pelagibius litoralis]NIA71262.1 hypothetical protein [Pelagibius litoralis]
MGNPQHYGIELPQRCLALINGLGDVAAQAYGGNQPELGPLTSTFLLSMSMPILNLPVERIERQIVQGDGEGYADDRHVNISAVEAFQNIIQQGILSQAPFYKRGAWRFVQYRGGARNIARGLPADIASALDAAEAITNAGAMPASQWISVLRNALAHGGVAYLDEQGRSSYGKPVKMYAFVSGKFDFGPCPYHPEVACRGERGPLIALNFLRITETDYRDFLELWVSWLERVGIAKAAA